MKLDKRLAEAIRLSCHDNNVPGASEMIIKFVENLAAGRIESSQVTASLNHIYDKIRNAE